MPLSKLVNKIGETTHIYIYDDVDSKEGFSAKDLLTAIKNIAPTDPLKVHINSIGGSVTEGLGIYNLLKAHQGPVETINEGVAASIASVIYLAGKTRSAYDNALFMIHGPQMGASSGNVTEMEATAKLMRTTFDNLKNIYAAHLTNVTDTQLNDWLLGETYFSADEAKQIGFVHNVVSLPGFSVKASLEKLVAKFQSLVTKTNQLPPSSGNPSMEFDKWLTAECELLDLDPAKLTAKQKTVLQARFNSLNNKAPTPPPLPQKNTVADAADELERQDAIQAAALDLGEVKLNADTLKTLGCKSATVKGLAAHAIRHKWTVDKFELEARRATVPDIGHVGIHSRNSVTEVNAAALSCAVSRASGMVASAKHAWTGREYGYEKAYDEKTLDASDRHKDISLLQIYDYAHRVAFGHRYEGRLGTDGFLNAARQALTKLRAEGNTTWSGLNIFDDAANKMLWAAYQSQNTTWQEWVKQVSVNDFKTHNFYRLTVKGGYQQIGADGMLKHGSFTDDKYTASADTYGKIVSLSRKDLINDDLGAFNGIMTSLGMEAALFLEELFYVHLLGQLATLFPTNDSKLNYISGAATALGVDALTTGETKYSNQVNADYAPILQTPSLLLVGTNQAVVARELYTQTMLEVLQTANTKGRPDNNPHVGKFRPVVSGYLNNTNIKQRIASPGTAVSGQSSTHWLLLATPSPQGAVVLGSFLNGRTTPFIEQADAEFDCLGMRWRAYHDAGADNGDPKLGVYSKGAA